MTLPTGSDLGPFASLAEDLQAITVALAATTTEREVIEIVLAPAVEALGAVAGIVLLVDHTDQQLKIAGSQGYEDITLTVWQEGPIENHLLIADILRMGEGRYFEYAGALKEAYPDLESRTGGLVAVANATLPMFLDNEPLGVVVLDFKEPHHFTPAERRFLTILSAQCAVALGRAAATRTLEAKVEERTRQLEEERAAQTVFVAFTEAVGSETDLLRLAQEAIAVLQRRFPGASAVYYEEERTLWKGRVWSDNLRPELIQVITAGIPSETPIFAQVIQTRQAVFTDGWDPQRERVASSEDYSAAGNYPLVIGDELHSLLSIGLRETHAWSEADRALFRAVGRGLNLALERTETARQVARQNAELQARTRALEAFAELTRDLALTTDPLLLIRRALEVMMSLLVDAAVSFYVLEDGQWHSRVQHGTLRSPELQAAVDAGLPYAETGNLVIPWTTGQPYYQDVYDHTTDNLPSLAGHFSATATLPLRMEGKLIGILAFVLFDQRHWSSVDRVVLETTVQSLELALDRAAAAQLLHLQKEEAERRSQALEAFAELSRDFAGETGRYALVRRAQDIVLSLLPPGYALYWEEAHDHWALKSQAGDIGNPELQRLVDEQGLPLEAPTLRHTWLTGEATYQDHYDQGADTPVELVRHVQAAAVFQVKMYGQAIGLLAIGLFDQRTWTPMDRAVLETAVYSLGLVLERAQSLGALAERTVQLEEANHELQASNDELEAFTYSASHDLRTPVRHVMGFAELAQRALAKTPNENAQRYLEVVKQGAQRMNALIDGMLVLSRSGRQELRVQPVDLNLLVLQAQRDVGEEFDGHPVRWRVAELPEVQGDREMLQQVMTNLLSNAVKYSAKHELSEVQIWCEENAAEWKISVQDNGVGFDPAYAQKLFGIFQRLHTEREFKGTGIGLATVRRIVLKHGGQVFAESPDDSGATFSFTLPKMP